MAGNSENPIKLTEKYERNGWPSLKRPDLKPPEGWSLSLITSLERIRSHALSSKGEIAFIKDGETLSDVFTMSSNGGWPSRVTTDRPAVPYWDDEIPSWSPDGNWLAFTMHDHVHIAPRRGGLPVKISDFTTAASSPRWMPDSIGLIITVERNNCDQLVLTDRDGSWPRGLTTDVGGDHWDPHSSPDGKYIVYNLRRYDDLNRLDINLIEISTGRQVTLYGKPSTRATTPKWSPDGRKISFISQESGWGELYLIGSDGQGLRQITKGSIDIVQYEWSPTGTRILLVLNRNGSFELQLLEVLSGSIIELSNQVGIHSNPNWATDESYITYEFESPTQFPDLYRMELPNKKISKLTFSTPKILENNKLVLPEVISYKSHDGLDIPAFLYRPEKSNGAAILYPHGGPKDQYGFCWDELAQYFTAKGYAYLAPNYRGSTGYGREYERANYNDWGLGDMQDCLFGAKYLQTIKGVKSDRIAITGGSYGGYLTANALSRDPEYLFACGIAKYGDSNLVSSWAQCEKRLRLYTEIFLGHPSQNLDAYRKGSPIDDIKNIKKPVLILHGLLDTIVPPEASEEWVEKLRREGKTFEYKTYGDEPHGFLQRKNLIDVYARMERFLDWYLLPFLIG
jgi:dipeptidyl aminopeptidase/acylaminoacyl peptidase